MNCYYQKQQSKPIESAATSFISSIFTSINTSDAKSFVSKTQVTSFNENCSCCRQKSENHNNNNESESTSAETYVPALASYLTFDVKMASTPIAQQTKKRKTFAHVEVKRVKDMFLAKEQCGLACDCYTSVSLSRQVTKQSYTEKPIRMQSASRRVHKNFDILQSNVTASEIVPNCNGYLKNLLKKSASSKAKKLSSDVQKMQAKKRMQKLNNVSTSTKKENTIVNLGEEKKKASHHKKRHVSRDNVRKIEEFKRKTNVEYGKRAKLETMMAVASSHIRQPMQNAESVINFNNYFPSSCLNKFNQLGQLQVWFV